MSGENILCKLDRFHALFELLSVVIRFIIRGVKWKIKRLMDMFDIN
jgi:hypothetical protein